jgi:regulatory protein
LISELNSQQLFLYTAFIAILTGTLFNKQNKMPFSKAIKPAQDIDAVRRSAFWHLGRRDHSEQQLREKLARKTANQQWIDTVIDECLDYNYLNDARFTESFIHSAHKKGYGINRIKRDLQQKGIATTTLHEALAENHFDYISRAVELLSRRYNTRLQNLNSKQKAISFLQSKGHDFDDIFRAIEQHNEAYPVDDCDYLSEAKALLARKFKTEISERKQHDKAMRFLLSRGYSYGDIQNAIRAHNEQIREQI